MLDSEAWSGCEGAAGWGFGGWVTSCSLEPPAEARRASLDWVENLSRSPDSRPEFRLGAPSLAVGPAAPGAGTSPDPAAEGALPCCEDLAGEAGVFASAFGGDCC